MFIRPKNATKATAEEIKASIEVQQKMFKEKARIQENARLEKIAGDQNRK